MMSREQVIAIGIGVIIGYFITAHFLQTGRPA